MVMTATMRMRTLSHFQAFHLGLFQVVDKGASQSLGPARPQTRTRLLQHCLDLFGPPQRRAVRRRRALLITDTELKLIAAAAIIGESSRPKTG
jgi:hypothetical protein